MNLNADEQVTVTLNVDAQNPIAVPVQVVVDLANGDTPADQVTKLQAAFDSNELAVTAFLDANGAIALRSHEYGEDIAVTAISDRAAGAGTSGIGDAVLSDTGTDLAGTIGGTSATVSDGNRLKGPIGFGVEGIEVEIPNDTSGVAGQVRIIDGLGEALPELIKELGMGGGILQSRHEGVNSSIEDIEDQIEKQARRAQKVEQRLRKQFTALEVQLASLNTLSEFVSQQMSLMLNSKKK